MKPDKAIELAKQCEQSLRSGKKIDHADAIKLGIEALQLLNNPIDPRLIYARTLLSGQLPFIDTTRSEHAIKRVLASPLGREPK